MEGFEYIEICDNCNDYWSLHKPDPEAELSEIFRNYIIFDGLFICKKCREKLGLL